MRPVRLLEPPEPGVEVLLPVCPSPLVPEPPELVVGSVPALPPEPVDPVDPVDPEPPPPPPSTPGLPVSREEPAALGLGATPLPGMPPSPCCELPPVAVPPKTAFSIGGVAYFVPVVKDDTQDAEGTSRT